MPLAAPLLTIATLTGAALLALPAASPDPEPALGSPGIVPGQARASGGVGAPGSAGVTPVIPLGPGGPASPLGTVPGVTGLTGRGAPVPQFRWPLSPAPRVLRRFAVGPQPWSPGHRGVDLAADVGRTVLAAGAGTVTFAGVVAGTGVVAVTHAGGIRTTYEPVVAQVAAGESVTAGAALGVLATSGHCPASCLHWGALRGPTYLDPLSLLRPPAPPILLPMGGPG